MASGIKFSVGKGGRNDRRDVITIQKLINYHLKQPGRLLVIDGICGPKTKAAISLFQRTQVKEIRADGRVDPHGKTIKKLFALGIGKGDLPPSLTENPSSNHRFEKEMRKVFVDAKKENEWNEFIKGIEGGSIPAMKIFLGTIGRVEDARAIAKMFLNFKKWGFSLKDINAVFDQAKKLNPKDAAKLFGALSETGSKAGKLFGFANGVAAKAGLIIALVECIIHARKGDYHMLFVEAYKFTMGKAIPWAAMIEGLQSLVDAILPESLKKNNTFFKVVRAIDPVGLGAAAVDSAGTLIQAAVDMVSKGKMDAGVMIPRLNRLVGRLKQGPTRIFAEMGENLGDALYEISKMTSDDWSTVASYSWSQFKSFFTSKK